MSSWSVEQLSFLCLIDFFTLKSALFEINAATSAFLLINVNTVYISPSLHF